MKFLVNFGLALVCGLGTMTMSYGDDTPMTPSALQTELKARRRDDGKIAAQIGAWFGADALTKGANPKVRGRDVAWAISAPGAKQVRVISEDGTYTLPLPRIGKTDTYAAAVTLPDGAGMRWRYDVDGKPVGGGNLEVYDYPAETEEQPGVPKGTVTQQPTWKSKIFDGTERDWWVYVPAQYKAETPACVMVFQDGGGPKNYMPPVLDNLIAKGDIPVTVGIFINPGHFPQGRDNRSFEYDTLSDQYARFLLEEILPEVEKTVKLRHDAASRAIAGISSGGICAWTVAWERPGEFSKVLSWVGSFTDLAGGPTHREGGHNYPFLIRLTEKKPIRVFLQDGENDLDNQFGNWPLCNQQMVKALAFKGYDYKFVFGHGFHSDAHGRALLPDSLRWLWQGYKPGL